MTRKAFINKQGQEISFSVSPTSQLDTRLWEDVFGDSQEDIEKAIVSFSSSGVCASLKCEGKTLAQFVGIEASVSSRRGIYVYALCTAPDERGRGYMRELLDLASEYFCERGYSFLFLLPANEALSSAYKRLGFSLCAPAYATPSPECEEDFFGIGEGELFKYAYCDFDGDVKKLYETSSKVFSYDVFKYCISLLPDKAEIKYFTDTDGKHGFIVRVGERIFLSSCAHSHLVKSKGECDALFKMLGQGDVSVTEINVEPMPR